MSWKLSLILVVSLFGCCYSQGQHVKFKLPRGTKNTDFIEGIVWVKVKSKHREVFLNSHAGGRIPSQVRAQHIQPLISQGSRNKSAARLTPRKVHTDIAQYFKIEFDKNDDIEDYINELYSTGYFDIVEPMYVEQAMFTPNDPAIASQYYLNLIKASQAWDITQGSPSIVIGIVDTGGDLNHPDLQNNIYIDPADPTDGIDNDGDGYIDNNRGWDFSGADIALIGTPGFQGDNNPAVFSGNKFGHGTMVAGCASATTNDGVGISGIGFSTKLLFTKHYADNQPENSNAYSSNLYEGILYAALHGAKIINCSWGNPNASGIAQDIINFVTDELGCLVVAAAGNSNNESPLYPAAYDNVLSVASSDENDLRSWFSNFGSSVDIVAPGSNIYTTNYDNGYKTDSGTSLSAPLVAGAAALVWAHNPDFTPTQVAEQLRISADETFYLNNSDFVHKLGKGRLDVARALTVESPSVRAKNQTLVNNQGEAPGPGESAKLYYDFKNYLKPSSADLTITLTSSSPFLTIVQNQFEPGALGANQSVHNGLHPFELIFAANLSIDQPVEALLTFTDGSYHDTQLVSFVMPSFIDVNENNITTSITTSGRIGYTNTQGQNQGSGFVYDDESILFEMGLIMGTSDAHVFDNVRGAPGVYSQDFTAASKIRKFTPGERSFSEVAGSFRNAPDSGFESLLISFRSMVWKDDPYKNFIILEYKLKNTTAEAIADFYMGIFADWDIASGGSSDRASWDNDVRLGYVSPAQPSTLPRAGIQALTGEPNYYAIDNDQTVVGNPFGIYDGFTDTEKFTTISDGLSRTQAGGTNGDDVSHVVGSGPYTIPAGEEITIAFALHGAGDLDELINSAKYADSLYNFTFKAVKPEANNLEVCELSDAILHASGATKFNWYTDHSGGTPVSSGSELIIPDLANDTILYVTNADNSYESLRTPVSVVVISNPVIIASGDIEFCEGGAVTLMAPDASEYTWSTGAKTQNLDVNSSGSYSVRVKNDVLECTSQPVHVIVHPLPSADFMISTEIEGDGYLVIFTNQSAGASNWHWSFGDGQFSNEESPSHHYAMTGSYDVSLTVTSAEGCEMEESKTVGLITGSEISLEKVIQLYPNPVYNEQIVLDYSGIKEPLQLTIFNSQGKPLHHSTLSPDGGERTINLTEWASGIYHVRISSATESVVTKVVVVK